MKKKKVDERLNENSNIDQSTAGQSGNAADKKLQVTKVAEIENYLNKHYVFRYNKVKEVTEWKAISDDDTAYQSLDDYKLNSIWRELEFNYLNTSIDKIRRILKSNYVPAVNPVQEYLENLKSIEGRENIKLLLSTIKVVNSSNFEEYFIKWLVATVANALIEQNCQNHTCLVLTGTQGKFKTTWLDNLCPKTLKDKYLYTGKINVENKDTLIFLAEYFIINIDDQLRNLNKHDENALKTIITLPSVKVRKPYGTLISELPRLASFVGSVNGNDFLTDPTGSRRFLPFQVEDIDINKAKSIDMDKVWAEAVTLYNSGFRYWMNDEEINALYENNEAFQVHTPEYELLIEYFQPCSRAEATQFLTSTAIQSRLQGYTKHNLRSKPLGEALTALRFEHWQKTVNGERVWVWSVKERPIEDVNKTRETGF